MTTPLATVPDDATWTFVDWHEAFPRLVASNPEEEDQLVISLASAGTETYGEFIIDFTSLGGGVAAQLKVFDEAWAVLHLSGLVHRLATMPKGTTKADLIALLVGMGMEDRTAHYRETKA